MRAATFEILALMTENSLISLYHDVTVRTYPSGTHAQRFHRETVRMRHETRYARSGALSIAYKVVGHGPIDLVFVMGWVSNIDMFWTEPHFARFLDRLASFSRLIVFDKRGTGLSDRPVALPTLEERMDDVRAVMDAVGSERAALFGVSEGGPMCALFAATYPERTRALVIDGGFARAIAAPDYPWGKSVAERNRYIQFVQNNWGTDMLIEARAPSLANDPRFREWWSTYLRMSASPGAALALSRMNWQIDVRHALRLIQAPTLVLHREGDKIVNVGSGRYLAEHIPNARYVEFPGSDHLPFTNDQDAILEEIECFLTGSSAQAPSRRVLATLMSVEIVGAIGLAARIGDEAWQRLDAAYDDVVRRLLVEFRGHEVSRSVAGVVAAFDGPARAILFGRRLVEGARDLDIDVRAGLHTGECDADGDTIHGVAVQTAPRVMSRAAAGEVLVSSTVHDLVAGSGIRFEPLDRPLAIGADRTLSLYRVVDEARRPLAIEAAGINVPPDALSALTPRERQVAGLIGRGLSNRMIADELSISIATVERHVANIFARLDVRSRAQVAVMVVNSDDAVIETR
jgi:pimeloyl-ACP methyl ester carboxylesterase/DNA-binding NarL/FixJ family response regulator